MEGKQPIVSGVLCFAAAKFDCFNGNCSLKVVMMFLGRVVSPKYMLSSFQLGYNKCLKYITLYRETYIAAMTIKNK